MSFQRNKQLAGELASRLQCVLASPGSPNDSISVAALHGSLCAGEGYGSDYDIDLAFWVEANSLGQALDEVARLGVSAETAIDGVRRLGDERIELLSGTGRMVGVRGHWIHEDAQSRIGLHAVLVSDALQILASLCRLQEVTAFGLLDDARFRQAEPFLRNYVEEALPIVDRRGLFETFRRAAATYPASATEFRAARLPGILSALPQTEAVDDLQWAIYSLIRRYRGNPKRTARDLELHSICELAPIFGDWTCRLEENQRNALQGLATSVQMASGSSAAHKEHLLSARCLLVHEDRVLLVKEKTEATLELPGGRVMRGETPEDGALRELGEECGLRATLRGPISIETSSEPCGMRVCIVFEATPQTTEALAGADIDACCWASRDEVERLLVSGRADWHDIQALEWFLRSRKEG
jgi:8-oxo-dGTP pyrophosphatase MutT (NUDIX family)